MARPSLAGRAAAAVGGRFLPVAWRAPERRGVLTHLTADGPTWDDRALRREHRRGPWVVVAESVGGVTL